MLVAISLRLMPSQLILVAAPANGGKRHWFAFVLVTDDVLVAPSWLRSVAAFFGPVSIGRSIERHLPLPLFFSENVVWSTVVVLLWFD